MLAIYKKQNGGVEEIPYYTKNCWVNVTNPTILEIDKLKKEYHLPDEFIEDILDVDERSRMEIDGRWLMILIRIPVYTSKEEMSFSTVPLGILISQNTIITICNQENELVNDILEGNVKGINIEDSYSFVLLIFNLSASYYLRFMKIIIRRTNQIEHDIRKSIENSQLNNLLKIQKSLVYFVTSLRSNDFLMNKLQRSKLIDINMIDQEVLEDVQIDYKQAIETATIHSDILTGMMDAFASVISNNLNIVMKRLTVITLCVMIPSIFSGLFGMNVPNFLEESPVAFYCVVAASLLVPTIVVIVLRRMRWF